jgi:hypothetical protein
VAKEFEPEFFSRLVSAAPSATPAITMGTFYSTFVTLIRPISLLGKRQTKPRWIRIPDNLTHWPWPRAVNPHMVECTAMSDAWLQSFSVFSPKAQAAFNRCQFGMLPIFMLRGSVAQLTQPGLLASLGYPTLNKGEISLLYA